MSEYNENVIKLLAVLKEKEYLFPKDMPQRVKFALYFDWFEKHNGKEFSQMPAMVHLSPDILDQFKKRIVWTGFAPTDAKTGAYGLHTLVQINSEYHIIFVFAYEDNQVSVIATLYVVDVQDYLKFMIENEKHILQNRTGMGFGGLGISIPNK